jgi:mannitol operon transcriptional antiterminator
VLQAQDKMRIQNTLSSINRGRLKERVNRRKEDDNALSLDSIRKLAGLGTEITELVEHFCTIPVGNVDDLEDLIQIAAVSMTDSPQAQDKLAEEFRKREQLSDTYIKEMEICLLHCKSNALEHSRFIYISLTEPVRIKNGILRGAVAMTVPAETEDEILLEPVGKLSALMVEDEGFLQALLRCDQTAGIRYIEKALVKYYQHEVTKIMEV